jgi:precorrin-6A/cobalt-precorrin-6A reductase
MARQQIRPLRRGWTTGACFAAATEVRSLVRLWSRCAGSLPFRLYEGVAGRGPFTLAEERHLFEQHAIDLLVCKVSGGAATEAKIAATRELSIPVVMVRHPAREPGDAVETVEAALHWLAGEHPFRKAERVS